MVYKGLNDLYGKKYYVFYVFLFYLLYYRSRRSFVGNYIKEYRKM